MNRNKMNSYRFLMGKPEGKKLLGRLKHRRVDNIKTSLRGIECDGMKWIDLAQNWD
jgi:hypothetical protein